MKVTLEIDGERLELNGYVQRVFREVILSLIETLHGVPDDWDQAEIELKK